MGEPRVGGGESVRFVSEEEGVLRGQAESDGERGLQLREAEPSGHCRSERLGQRNRERSSLLVRRLSLGTISTPNRVRRRHGADLPSVTAVGPAGSGWGSYLANLFTGLVDVSSTMRGLDLHFTWWWCMKSHRSNQFQFQILT